MKVFSLILAVIVASALEIGGLLLVVLYAPSAAFGVTILAVLAVTALVYGPLMLGSMTAYWNMTKTVSDRAYFRRWLWIIVGIEALGAIAMIIFALLAPAPWWLPVTFIAAGLVLTPLSLVVGRALYRHGEAHSRPALVWSPVTRSEMLRRVAVVAITFVTVLVLGLVVFGLIESGSGHALTRPGTLISFALQFALLAAAFACIVITVPLNRRLRDAVGGELGTIRKVSKVVLRKRPVHLDEDEQAAAARYAAIIPATLAFTIGYVTLLYVALGIQQIRLMTQGFDATYSVVYTGALVVVLLVAVPFFTLRVRRARRYARDHMEFAVPNDES
ncbi:hypothetical protein OSC27_11780 [Microbacterium sp. STN6]|uniref:hypothetical protein n=1 Tax=Microbacterium sp. STN6 TaxID=2995588 RepID=UPI0022609990|nr:hypothetical protein [Microbacterium sp. STN6]MCX7522953.1 hypothetical protein [Microbacterium sp. STN6]